ncbi:MAG: DUF1467 family protein [Sphingomonadaceae bacterium]|nr:DUF1467 family protein [Sphingomonadaceae bacterium]
MLWTSSLAIYFLFWFACLFFVLPFHGRRADDVAEPGHDRGAPSQFRPWRIIGQVSLLAAVVFGLFYANYIYGWITRENIDLMHNYQPK